MGGDLPKQFIPMEGKPVLMHTLEAFHRWDASVGLILVLPEDHQPYWKMLCQEIGCKVPHRIANGGETRFHSVQNGLHFLSDEIRNLSGGDEKTCVAVHDGVRPFVAPEVIDRCFAEAEVSGAAIRSCLWSILSASFPVSRAVRSIVRVIRRCKPRRFSIMICF